MTIDRAADSGTPPNRVLLVLTLGALVAIGPLSIDMYLPALPSITRDLMTTESTVQLTVSGTVLGLALGQLLVGPLSDTVGRRIPLIVGTLVHVAASLLCLVAPTVDVLIAARIVQGLGDLRKSRMRSLEVCGAEQAIGKGGRKAGKATGSGPAAR
jgi:MFS family permease